MEQIQIDDIKNYQFLSGLKHSPSGKKSALIVKSAKEDGYHSVIYLCKDKAYQPLTALTGNIPLFTWLDDETILFSETREENTQKAISQGFEKTPFYKISVNGGEGEFCFEIDLKVTDIQWIKDGKFLISAVYNNNYPDLSAADEITQKQLLAEFEREKDYQVADELPFYFNGKGFVNKLRQRLYLYHDGKVTPITPPLYNTNLYTISPCKSFIAFTGTSHEHILDQRSEINLYDIEKNEIKIICEMQYYISKIAFLENKIIFAGSERKLFGTVEDPDFYAVDLNGTVSLLKKFGYSIGSVPGSDCRLGGGTTFKAFENNIYFTSLHNYTADLYKFDTAANLIEKMTDLKGAVDFFDISPKGISLCGFFGGKLMEVYDFKGNEITQISTLNEKALENKFYSKPIHHSFKDKEGFEIDGWAMLPINYDENKKYPCILNIHGGPKAAYGDIFFHEMQYWASRGYFVIFSNPRGSDGKSNEFANIRGIYGTVDYENIMAFTEEMLKKYPAIDENRLGVTGGSYGGYMTNWIVGHTDKFKAAAAQRSIANWMSLTYTSDIGYYFDTDQARADAWNNPEQVWDMSPLKYAENVKTPLLLIHSDQDYRCGVWEAYQMFTAVKLRGVDARMFVFHGENHELSRSGKPRHRIRRLREITDWMDKYLNPQE